MFILYQILLLHFRVEMKLSMKSLKRMQMMWTSWCQ